MESKTKVWKGSPYNQKWHLIHGNILTIEINLSILFHKSKYTDLIKKRSQNTRNNQEQTHIEYGREIDHGKESEIWGEQLIN